MADDAARHISREGLDALASTATSHLVAVRRSRKRSCASTEVSMSSAGLRRGRDDQTSGQLRQSAHPPVALTIDVFARILAEVGCADDEDLEALWPGLVASP
jgi:hypothetical protein